MCEQHYYARDSCQVDIVLPKTINVLCIDGLWFYAITTAELFSPI